MLTFGFGQFYCRVYYAEQFRALRSLVFPAGEERFVRSLSRCAPWAASGGKSGSTFCKTLGRKTLPFCFHFPVAVSEWMDQLGVVVVVVVDADDRFVLKQMSKMEIQSFEDLGPNYVAYVTAALDENRPTTLCKIVGAFRIVFKNGHTGAASKQDLLVMENLFYKYPHSIPTAPFT